MRALGLFLVTISAFGVTVRVRKDKRQTVAIRSEDLGCVTASIQSEGHWRLCEFKEQYSEDENDEARTLCQIKILQKYHILSHEKPMV